MILTQSKSLAIVYNSATKQCAEFLYGLIGELDAKGAPVNAIIVDDKNFAKLDPINKPTMQKILYIGDFAESRAVSKNILKWQFDRFGFRYGWLGNKAVITFDSKRMSEDDFYKMAEFAKTEFKKYDIDMAAQVGEANFWDSLSLGGKIGIGVGGVAVIALGVIFGLGGRDDDDFDKYSGDSGDSFGSDPMVF